MKKILLLLVGICLMQWAGAQSGDDLFKQKDYIKAVVSYEKEAKTNPSKYMPLAKCYFAQKQFDRAVDALKMYKLKANTADTFTANQWLRLLGRPDDETRQVNLGPKINSSSSEYFPHVSSDGKKLYFTGRDYTNGKGGEDIYVSEKQTDGNWGEPKNMEFWNTSSHEDVMTTSSDGNTAILFGNYNGTFGYGDLFYSVNTGGGWSMPCNLGGGINTSHWEAQAALGPDGKTLVFCSDRDDQKDLSDIFVSFLTENGWSKPLNLGAVINRKGYGEYSPILAADHKTLYFSSDRPGGFGGQDIYMSRRLDDTWTNWSEPVNLGKYINTLEDNKFMTIPASGNKAYTTIYDAPDGYGKYDLYEFILPLSMRPEKTFTVRGVVTNEVDSAAGLVIKYIDAETAKEVSRVSSSQKDGKYYVSLPARKKYYVVIDMKGYLFFQDVLDLTKPELYQSKFTIQDKMGDQMTVVRDLKIKLDQYNARLGAILESKSLDIGEEFKKYQQLLDDYKMALAQLDQSVYKAKSDWLSEENALEAIVNYKVTRIKIGAKFELKNIFFDFGKASLKDESKTELDKLVDIMNRSDIVIELGGHTDNVGSDDANLKLSQDRVTSVKNYLVGKGISENRIAAIGYGETQPIASNDNEESRSKSRRVEVKITEIKPKEGSGDYANIDQKEKDQKIDFTKFDMLTALQKAAKIGGVPEGSFCSDKVVYIDRSYKNTKKDDYKSREFKDFSGKDWGKETIEMEEWHYKNFAAHLTNFGYKPTGSGFGVGATFINKDRRETYFSGFGPTGNAADGTKWGMSFGQLWTAAIKKPVCFSFGYDLHLYKSGFKSLKSPNMTIDGTFGAITVPWGLRGIIKLTKGVVLNPEVFYYSNILTSKTMRDVGYGRGSYFHIGANIRMKFLQGGIFYNYGSFVRFVGMRAGVTF